MMHKTTLIALLQATEGDEVKIEGRVSDECVDIGNVEATEDGSIVLRPE
jgi:hypothetical protein